MRLLALIIPCLVPACYAKDPPANGLDGQLEFDAPALSAVATSTPIGVARGNPGSETCTLGKGGDNCNGGSYSDVVIDTADCGDGCTATITNDGLVTVVESMPGDFELAVAAHRGSETWADRFPLHAAVAKSFAVVSADRQPLGIAYATEVGARMPLYVCLQPTAAVPEQDGDLACLAGDFPQTLRADGVVALTPTLAIPNDNPITPAHQPFAVELAAAGTGHLVVGALGMTRTFALRAAAPAEWTRIELAPYDIAAGAVRDIGRGDFVGSPITTLELDPGSFGIDYMAATAVLADGSRALLSASRIACRPAGFATATAQNFSNRITPWSPDGVGLWASLVDVPDYTNVSAGDATCAVTGFEQLGSLAVHVQP